MKLIFSLFLIITSLNAQVVHEKYENSGSAYFQTYQGLRWCTHEDSNFAYAITLNEYKDVKNLFVHNMETSKVAKYSYEGWVYRKYLVDSRLFKKIEGDSSLPAFVALRHARYFSNDVIHLSSYTDEENHEIILEDENFSVTSTNAWTTIFRCSKD